MATEYDNKNRGALFQNDKKGNEKAPDLTGKITIVSPDGEVFDMWVSAWMKTSQKGDDFISLALSEPKDKASNGKSLAEMKQQMRDKKADLKKSIEEDLSDEIPF